MEEQLRKLIKEFDIRETGNKFLDEQYKETILDVLVEFIGQEIEKAREEGYKKGWEDGSKGKVFEKIEVETEVHFKDLKDIIGGKEGAGEFLSKLTTK